MAGAYGSHFRLDVSDDERRVIYTAEDASHPSDIWLAEFDFKSPRRIRVTNPEIDKYLMGESRVVEWRSEDGERLQGAVLLPAGYQPGQRYPVIVEVYGGRSGSNEAHRYALGENGVRNLQLLATRG